MIYKERYKVELEDIGRENKIDNKRIVTIMEDIAGSHSDKVGLGVSASANKKAWVLLDWKIKILKRPAYNEYIDASTWSRKSDRLCAFRDFELYDQNGELCAIGTSRWLYMDLVRRRPIIDNKMNDIYGTETEKNVFDEEIKKIELPDLDNLPDNIMVTEKPYLIQRRDIDINGHLHNVSYLEAALEAVPEDIYKNVDFNYIRIEYKKEIMQNDNIKIKCLTDNNYNCLVIFETDNKMASSEKLKALQAAMEKIEKSFGKGSIMKMGEEVVEQVEVIPTGSIALNAALGVGGYPRGRIIEIYGPESSGKTTLAIHAIAEAQKAGGIAAFIDAEHAFDRFYAAKLGVDVDNLFISQPDNGEQALEIAEQLIRSSAIDIIVVDSVAALTPKAEIEGDMGDNKVGLQARLMSQALRKLTSAVSKTRTTCIFINQLREKIGVMFGNPETTTGGNALKFYASVRLDIRGGQAIKNGEEVIGKQTKVKVVKNKVAPPFRRAEFDIMFGEGISRAGEIIDLGAELGIIKKSGSWFSYNDTKIAQGRDAAKQVILDNPELAEELEGLIFEELKKEK